MTQKEVINILAEPEITHCIYEISELHMYTKHYLLIAEELCEDGVAFLQPLKEHRDAYDHFMRVFACPVKNLDIEDAKIYILENIKKAFGHEYRAFFDTADWLTYICRKFVREQLSTSVVKRKYKEQYADYDCVRDFINSLAFSIASYREAKDINNQNSLLAEVQDYKVTLDRLLDIYKKIQAL